MPYLDAVLPIDFHIPSESVEAAAQAITTYQGEETCEGQNAIDVVEQFLKDLTGASEIDTSSGDVIVSFIEWDSGTGTRGLEGEDTLEKLNLIAPFVTSDWAKEPFLLFSHIGGEFMRWSIREGKGVIERVEVQFKVLD